MNKVALTGISKENEECREDVLQRINRVIGKNVFILGKEVEEFEQKWAEVCKVKYAVGVSNGTDALYLALKALDIGRDDEVITVPNTFIATVSAILRTGASVKFVDVDLETLLMNPIELEKAITEKTRAIIPVHLHGQMVDMISLKSVADKYGIKIVEDAAQAHLAEYKGISPGELSDVACFSFFPTKNLGAFGDAGAVITNDYVIQERIRRLRNHGRTSKDISIEPGMNARMDELQAAVLNAKIPHLKEWTEERRKNADKYYESLPTKTIALKVMDGALPVYHHFVVKVDDHRRKALMTHLHDCGIETGIHYPIPLHLQPACQMIDCNNKVFPNAERTACEKLSLPLHSSMPWEVEYVCDMIKEFYAR